MGGSERGKGEEGNQNEWEGGGGWKNDRSPPAGQGAGSNVFS